MKDSQHDARFNVEVNKYIKANNERFSTEPGSGARSL